MGKGTVPGGSLGRAATGLAEKSDVIRALGDTQLPPLAWTTAVGT